MEPPQSPLREALSGLGVLFRGFGMVLRRPRLFLLGAIPPLVTSLLFLALLITLLLTIADLVTWMTPFADGWATAWSAAVRVALGVAIVAGAVLVMVVGFTGITLALGAPLYDRIAEGVEEELGAAPPEVDEGLLGSVTRSIRQALTLILVSALVTVPLFVGGFVPVVGQTVVPVVSALFGGWMLCTELVGTAFDRRGLRRLKDRRRHMATRRMRVLGFSVPTYLLLAVPFLAVVVFPAAAAGGTILARQLLPAASPQHQWWPPHHPGPAGQAGHPPAPPRGDGR